MKYLLFLSLLSILVVCRIQGKPLGKEDSGEIEKHRKEHHHPHHDEFDSNEELHHHDHHHSGEEDKDLGPYPIDIDEDRKESVEVDPNTEDVKEDGGEVENVDDEKVEEPEVVIPEESNTEESSDAENAQEPEENSDAETPVEEEVVAPEEANFEENADSESTSNNETILEPNPEENSDAETPVDEEAVAPEENTDSELPVTEDEGQPEVVPEEFQIDPVPVENDTEGEIFIQNLKVAPSSLNTDSMKRETPENPESVEDPKVDDAEDTEEIVPLDESGVNVHVGEEGDDPVEEEQNLEAGKNAEEGATDEDSVEEEEEPKEETEEKLEPVEDSELEIPEDERFPPEMLPEQPKDVIIQKHTSEEDTVPVVAENEESVPEIDIDNKTLENFKSASGGIAFDVPLEDSVEMKEKKDGSNVPDSETEIDEENDDDEDYNEDDDNVEEDEEMVPVVPEIVDPEIISGDESIEKDSPTVEKVEEENLDTAYPSELEDDFNVDHETGLMPSDTDILSEEDGDFEDANYKVLDDMRDELDKALRDSNNYIVTEELLDPVQNTRKFVVQRPSYRAFDQEENNIIKEIKKTIDENPRFKRQMMPDLFSSSESAETVFQKPQDGSLNHEGVIQPLAPIPDFPVPKAFDFGENVEASADPILKAVAEAMENTDNFEEDSSSRENIDLEAELKDFEASKVQEDFGDSDEEDEDNEYEDYEPILIVPEFPRQGKTLGEILGIPESKGPVMIEPESFYGPHFSEEMPSAYYEEYGPYEVPQKIVIETNHKMTVIYDDESESKEVDASDSEGSEEVVHKEVLESGNKDAPEVMDLDSHDAVPEIVEKEESAAQVGSEFEEVSKTFSQNLIMTLSVSPKMLIMLGAILIVVFIFKMFFLWYSPHKVERGIKQAQDGQEVPISVVTVDKKPLP